MFLQIVLHKIAIPNDNLSLWRNLYKLIELEAQDSRLS